MMICSEIAKKLKKINSSILNTKGKCMNKYTICDNQTEQVKNDFDKDLVLAKQKELINEILNLTDKYLTKASDFEIAEIKAISAKIKSDGALNKQIIYKNDEDEKQIAKSVLADEKYNDFVASTDSLKSQIKQCKFKLFYLNSLKKQAIKDCNIAKAVALTDKISVCENLLGAINYKLETLSSDVKNSELDFFERYLEVLNFVAKDGKVEKTADNLRQKFSSDVVDYFVCNKMMFVIGRYLGMVEISKIAQAFQSEEIKKVFGVVASKIQGELQKCGNK